jgi:hypothetical protein
MGHDEDIFVFCAVFFKFHLGMISGSLADRQTGMQ